MSHAKATYLGGYKAKLLGFNTKQHLKLNVFTIERYSSAKKQINIPEKTDCAYDFVCFELSISVPGWMA